MNKQMKNVCCVCSGPGEHDVYNRIPVNVHANPNEFRFWRQSIAEMIADISGVYVSVFYLNLIFLVRETFVSSLLLSRFNKH